MGRPPKPPAEKRGQRVLVSMTQAELQELTTEAKKHGMTISQILMRPWREEE